MYYQISECEKHVFLLLPLDDESLSSPFLKSFSHRPIYSRSDFSKIETVQFPMCDFKDRHSDGDGGVIWWWNNVSVGVVRHPIPFWGLPGGTIAANDRGCDNLTEHIGAIAWLLAGCCTRSLAPLSPGIASTISRYYTRLSARDSRILHKHTHTHKLKPPLRCLVFLQQVKLGFTSEHFVLDNILNDMICLQHVQKPEEKRINRYNIIFLLSKQIIMLIHLPIFTDSMV